MSDPAVVIVGAGAAGIAAGLELTARGIPFVILEAQHRIGGRASDVRDEARRHVFAAPDAVTGAGRGVASRMVDSFKLA